MFDDLKNTCQQIWSDRWASRLFRAAAHGRLPRMQDLLDDDELRPPAARRSTPGAPAASRRSSPTISSTTPTIPILQHLRHRGLFNAADDPVKMVFHPQFVTATSPLINLDYEQFVRGCHMGIFPSYYEPWGYTPMECVALGLPAVTTDLSGFGAYVQHHIPERQPSRASASSTAEPAAFDETVQRPGRSPDEFRAAKPPPAHRNAQPRRTAQRNVRLVGTGRATTTKPTTWRCDRANSGKTPQGRFELRFV